jgi:hypothetical protein
MSSAHFEDALMFSSNELHTYASADLNEQQYQFQQCVKKDNKQKLHLNDGDVLCSVPLNILAPKLTLKAAKELANLRDMYMPSKILLGGVGHCFAWHVRVSIGLYFNFKTEELVYYRLCVM